MCKPVVRKQLRYQNQKVSSSTTRYMPVKNKFQQTLLCIDNERREIDEFVYISSHEEATF